MTFRQSLSSKLQSELDLKLSVNSLIRGLTHENFDAAVLKIQDLSSLNDEFFLAMIARSVRQFLFVHPQTILLSSYFVLSISNIINDEKKMFFVTKLQNFCINSIMEYHSTESSFFLGLLVRHRLISASEGLNISNKIVRAQYISCLYYYLIAAGQVIEEFDSKYLDELLDELYSSMTSFHSNTPKALHEQLVIAREDNWNIANKWLKFKPSFDSMENMIHFDAFDDFLEQVVSSPTFNVNQSYSISIWEPVAYINVDNLPLIAAAAFYGSIKIFKYLFINKAELNYQRDRRTKSLISYAVAGGNVEIIRLLEQQHVDFESSIQTAAEYDQAEAFFWLDQMIFQNLSIRDNRNRTLLHCAALSNSIEICLYILDQTQEYINEQNNMHITPLVRAALNGSVEVLLILLSCPKIDLTIKYEFERTILHIAAINNDIEIAQIMLSRDDTDVNARDYPLLMTPLFIAAYYGSLNVAKLLLSNPKVDMSIMDRDASTVFQIAAMNGNISIARYLYENYEFDVNHLNNEVKAALHKAIEIDSFDMTAYLLSLPGINVNIQDKNKQTPLIIAVIRHNVDIVSILLKHEGINPNIQSYKGAALIHAAEECTEDNDRFNAKALDILKLLVSVPEIDLNCRDQHGRTPLLVAVAFKATRAVKLLCETPGVDISKKTKKGLTALDIAATDELKDMLNQYIK